VDVPLADRLSEDRVKSDLSHRKLDQVLQTYLDVWRSTRKRRDDALVVQARDLVKEFPRTGFSLGPVSFDLIAAEITGVIGMNASGKTTLLRLILGEIAPSSGSFTYPKLSTRRGDWLSIRNQIGYVAQMPERWHGRLRLNLNYTAAAYGSLGKENDELVDWFVHRYGLKEYEDATWDLISGGFKIRFELVRALLTKPKLLVLDEPLAYLDIVTQQIFLSDIRSISSALDNPIPIIITSQHLYEIEAIANKMIILDDGHCLYSGPILQMPPMREFRTYEIAVGCKKKELLEALRPFGLVDIEVTMTSYLLTFPRDADHTKLAVALITRFGDQLTYLRDITHSTRSLFRNKRDDIVYDAPER
jgi:ABC-type multidrug transport system ATPase subunit